MTRLSLDMQKPDSWPGLGSCDNNDASNRTP